MNDSRDQKSISSFADISNCANCQKLAALQEKVAALEERLGQTSQNSSKPPSSDPPGAVPRVRREPGDRKRGGQPGHERSTRPLIPTEQADKVISLKPPHCEKCNRKLSGNDPAPRRHQVTEIEVKTQVTEYQQHTLNCACGHQATAALPAAAVSCFGAHLETVAALLTGAYHLSKRAAQEISQDLFGVEMSLGALSGCEEKAGALLQEPVEEAHEWVQKQGAAHADETGRKEGKQRAWLWVWSTALVTVFKVHARRTSQAAKELLGNFAGVLHTDRWGAYNIYPGLRQICRAHLLRDFRRFSEHRGPAAGRIGKALLKRARRLLKLWSKVRDGTQDHRLSRLKA